MIIFNGKNWGKKNINWHQAPKKHFIKKKNNGIFLKQFSCYLKQKAQKTSVSNFLKII